MTGTAYNGQTATPYSYIAAASTGQDSNVIKAKRGLVVGVTIHNVAAAVRYVKLYDTIAGSTPASTDVPVIRYEIPAGSTFVDPTPTAFGSQISFRMTVNQADSDATAVTAGDIVLNVKYQ